MNRKYKLMLTRVIAVIMALSLCGCGAAQTAASSAPAEQVETVAVTAEATATPAPTIAPEPETTPVVEASAEEAAPETVEAEPEEDETVDPDADVFVTYATEVETFTAQNMPLYLDAGESSGDVQINFLNSIYDIPYVSLDTAADLLTAVFVGAPADDDEDEDSEDTEDSEDSEDTEDTEDSDETSGTDSGTTTGTTAARVLTAEKDTDTTDNADDAAVNEDDKDTEAADDTADEDSEAADDEEEDTDTEDSESLISQKDDSGFSLDVTEDSDGVFVLTRENGSIMLVNFNEGTISFSDIDLFTANPGAASGLDMVGTGDIGDKTLLTHSSSFYKNPQVLTIDLNAYSIFPVYQDGVGYLPLQTISDLLVSRCGCYVVCNGESVIITSAMDDGDFVDAMQDVINELTGSDDDDNDADTAEDSSTTDNGTTAMRILTAEKDTDNTDNSEDTADDADTKDTDSEDTEDTDSKDSDSENAEKTVGEVYYSVDAAETSDELAVFNYNELCMALDFSYGLQDEHEIISFNKLFSQTGLYTEFASSDAGDTYLALMSLCDGYFADLHSSVGNRSCYTDPEETAEALENAEINGDISTNISHYAYSASTSYSEAREEYYPDGIKGYEEVGDTAYITFDSFVIDSSRDYYDITPENNADDTIELIAYANEQIQRDDSPIKNVVIDLTNNTGGYLDAGVAVVAWMLGEAEIAIEDAVTGAQSTCTYTFDANLDGKMDSDDYLGSDYNLYCLISPNSFSCGNLVPAALKASGKVTLLGKASNGGACAVMAMSTANGNTFQVSGPYRLSTVNNGTYYSVDEGVDPDITITKLSHFYDRTALTEEIDDLF